MNWKIKLVLFSLLLGWCILLGYIAINLDWSGNDAPLTHEESVENGKLPLMQHWQNMNSDTPVRNVVLATDDKTMIGMFATVNSIISNTNVPVKFHLITFEENVSDLTNWIKRSKLFKISYEIAIIKKEWVFLEEKPPKENNSPPNWSKIMQYARLYIPKLFPNVKGKIVYLDNDIIVQGNIDQLLNTTIDDNYGAFPDDCTSVSKRFNKNQVTLANYLNFNSPEIKKLKLNPNSCSFNTGLFVTDVDIWKKFNLTGSFQHWLQQNAKENLLASQFVGEAITPIMMIVFNQKISYIEPMWHVGHLGFTSGSQYSRSFLRQAKLLHWDGRFKPWRIKTSSMDFWDKYYVPDPTGKFKLTRRA